MVAKSGPSSRFWVLLREEPLKALEARTFTDRTYQLGGIYRIDTCQE